MDLKTGTLLVPPTVKNSSCSHPRYSSHNFIIHIGIAETIEALLILVLTLGVIGANALVIFVINNRRYSPYIHQQPRYLLTSLALNDLTIGLLITPFSLLPALFHCWPYGEIFCQIQALLRGALSQQSAVILVCMAVDRYMCALHPRRYYKHSSKKGCVAILSITWIISLTIFGFLVLPKGYYFNQTGLMACEPFYSKPSYRILSTCALYFPTTMVLMYCYGSSFHMSRFRLNDPTTTMSSSTLMPPHTAAAAAAAAAHHASLYHHHHQHQHQQQQHQQHAVHPHQHQHHGGHAPHVHLHHPHQHQHSHSALHSHAMTPTSTTGTMTMAGTPTNGSSSGGGGGATPGSTTLPNSSAMNMSMAMSLGLGMGPKNTITKKIVPIQEKNSSGSTSRSMAAISLGFIVMVTPWTIQEIVTACTGSKLPPFLDFLVTWTALSNSLWNPFMYWLLNSDFRRLSRSLLPKWCFPAEDSTPEQKSPCCHINNSDFEITTLPMPPEPPTSRPPKNGGNGNNGGGNGGGVGLSSGGSVLGICARSRANSLSRSASACLRGTAGIHQHHGHSHYGGTAMRPDIEGLSEKYWGEILERTVSSNSLHAMQKNFPHTHHHIHHISHHQQPQKPQQHNHMTQTNPTNTNTNATAMTTSFSKYSDLNLHMDHHQHPLDMGGSRNGYDLSISSKFSNSEPKLCEHSMYHDANCAKNKSSQAAAAAAAESTTTTATTMETKLAGGGRSIPDI